MFLPTTINQKADNQLQQLFCKKKKKGQIEKYVFNVIQIQRKNIL